MWWTMCVPMKGQRPEDALILGAFDGSAIGDREAKKAAKALGRDYIRSGGPGQPRLLKSPSRPNGTPDSTITSGNQAPATAEASRAQPVATQTVASTHADTPVGVEGTAGESITASLTLHQLAEATCERLGYRLAPEDILRINRKAYALAVDHRLNRKRGFNDVAKALKASSKRVDDAEKRWQQRGGVKGGWGWFEVCEAYDAYWPTMNNATGYLLDLLDSKGIEPPRSEHL